MPRSLWIRVVLLMSALVLPAGAQAGEPTVAEAVVRGMSYATEHALTWQKEKKCSTCLHLPMALWVINVARSRDMVVDESAAASLRNWIQDESDSAAFIPALKREVDEHGAPIGAAFALMALASGSAEQVDARFVRRVATYYAESQGRNGAWLLGSDEGMPPIFEGRSVTTRLVRLALSRFPAYANGDPGEPDVSAADAWLDAHPAETQQEQVLDLLLAVRRGLTDAAINREAEELLLLQRDDAGWSQTPDMASDAYATGQALYALGIAARHASKDERLQRAVRFLLNSQREDGSWAMLSRPAQGESGVHGGEMEPITMAGTCWALLGLIRAGL